MNITLQAGFVAIAPEDRGWLCGIDEDCERIGTSFVTLHMGDRRLPSIVGCRTHTAEFRRATKGK